jgi:hypothetical protein
MTVLALILGICLLFNLLIVVAVTIWIVSHKKTTEHFSSTSDVYGNVATVMGKLNNKGEYLGSWNDANEEHRLSSLQQDPLCMSLINQQTLPVVTGCNDCAHNLIAKGILKNLRNNEPFFRPTDDRAFCYFDMAEDASKTIKELGIKCARTGTPFDNPMFHRVYTDKVTDASDPLFKERCILEINRVQVVDSNMNLFNSKLSNANICKDWADGDATDSVIRDMQRGRIMMMSNNEPTPAVPIYKKYNSTPRDCVALCMNSSNCKSIQFDDVDNTCRHYQDSYASSYDAIPLMYRETTPFTDPAYRYGRLWNKQSACLAEPRMSRMRVCKLHDNTFCQCHELAYDNFKQDISSWYIKTTNKTGSTTQQLKGTPIITSLLDRMDGNDNCVGASNTTLVYMTWLELYNTYTLECYQQQQCTLPDPFLGPYIGPSVRITCKDNANRSNQAFSDHMTNIILGTRNVDNPASDFELVLSNLDSILCRPSQNQVKRLRRYMHSTHNSNTYFIKELVHQSQRIYALSMRAVRMIHPETDTGKNKLLTATEVGACGFARVSKQTTYWAHLSNGQVVNTETTTPTPASPQYSHDTRILQIALGPKTHVTLRRSASSNHPTSWIKFYNRGASAAHVNLPHPNDIPNDGFDPTLQNIDDMSFSQLMHFYRDYMKDDDSAMNVVITFDAMVSGGRQWYSKMPFVGNVSMEAGKMDADPIENEAQFMLPRGVYTYDKLSSQTSNVDCTLSNVRYNMEMVMQSSNLNTSHACVSACASDPTCMGMSYDIDNKCAFYKLGGSNYGMCSSGFYRYDAGMTLLKRPSYMAVDFWQERGDQRGTAFAFRIEYDSCGTSHRWQYRSTMKRAATMYRMNNVRGNELAVSVHNPDLPIPEKNAYMSMRKIERLVLGPMSCAEFRSPDRATWIQLHNITEEEVILTLGTTNKILVVSNIPSTIYDDVLKELVHRVNLRNANEYILSCLHASANYRKVYSSSYDDLENYSELRYGYQDLSSIQNKDDYTAVSSLTECLKICNNINSCKSLMYNTMDNKCTVMYECVMDPMRTQINEAAAYLSKTGACLTGSNLQVPTTPATPAAAS